MERNANYALVGLASTILLIGLVVFVVWLGQLNHKAYDYYDIVFHGPISGLSTGGEVHFNGIKLGEVSHIYLDKKDPNLVIATVKVDADTPVRVDSYATLEPQGITSVNYVQITAGTPSKPLLKDVPHPDSPNPRLQGRHDALSDLLAGGSVVMQKAVDALDRVNRVLSDDNIKTFSAAISDVQSVTAELRQRKAIIGDAQKALQSADQAAQRIRDLASTSEGLVNGDARHTIVKLGDAATEIEGASKDLRAMMAKLEGPTTDFATTGLPQLTSAIASLQQATDNLDRAIGEVQQNPRGLLGKAPAREVEVKP